MYCKQFAVAMLMANASATQVAEANAATQLFENKEFRTAVTNSAQYALEIKDYKKAGEIVEIALKTQQVEEEFQFGAGVSKDNVGDMLTGFLENMNVGDLSVTFEIKNCLISSSVSLAFVGAFYAVIETEGYCDENSPCFGPFLLKIASAFIGIFTSAIFSLFICRPRFADFS
jgi:hypothetical protein